MMVSESAQYTLITCYSRTKKLWIATPQVMILTWHKIWIYHNQAPASQRQKGGFLLQYQLTLWRSLQLFLQDSALHPVHTLQLSTGILQWNQQSQWLSQPPHNNQDTIIQITCMFHLRDQTFKEQGNRILFGASSDYPSCFWIIILSNKLEPTVYEQLEWKKKKRQHRFNLKKTL